MLQVERSAVKSRVREKICMEGGGWNLFAIFEGPKFSEIQIIRHLGFTKVPSRGLHYLSV